MPNKQIVTSTNQGNERVITQPFTVVGSVVIQNDKYLLIEQNGKWNLPTGWLEKEESIIDGAKRETEEETGLGIDIDKFIGIFTLIKRKKDVVLHAVKILFTSHINQEVIDSDDKLNHNWFTLKQIQEMRDQLWDQDLPEIIRKINEGEVFDLSVVDNMYEV